jgi:hypothetical protein
MKSYKEFLEENLKKMGALKKQIRKTADSKDAKAMAGDEFHYGGDREDAEKHYDAVRSDHEDNVHKLKKMVKDVRKDPRGQKHMGDMVKKGKQRAAIKKSGEDHLKRREKESKEPLKKDSYWSSSYQKYLKKDVTPGKTMKSGPRKGKLHPDLQKRTKLSLMRRRENKD